VPHHSSRRLALRGSLGCCVLQLCQEKLEGAREITDIRGQANFSKFRFTAGPPGTAWQCHIAAFAVWWLLATMPLAAGAYTLAFTHLDSASFAETRFNVLPKVRAARLDRSLP
jgi:hypothetical protein